MPPLADLLTPEEHMAGIAAVTTESCKTNFGRSKEDASGKYLGQLNLSIELGFCDLFNLKKETLKGDKFRRNEVEINVLVCGGICMFGL